MSIGGFGSLAVVAALRNLGLLNFGFLPPWIAISQQISLAGISALTVSEATNLIVTQCILATVGGVLVGSLRIVVIEGETTERKNLNDPWEEFEHQAAYDEKLTVITESGDQITGRLLEVGNTSTENELLLTNPKESQFGASGLKEGDSRGEISYHHQEDISRIILHKEWDAHDRTRIERLHRDFLNHGLTIREVCLGVGGSLWSRLQGMGGWLESTPPRKSAEVEVDKLEIDEEVSVQESTEPGSEESAKND
jgi:hypothetical protein